jgi:hypothetical protein
MPGPLTGGVAWFGEQMQEGIGMKVAELNAAGGVLGVEKVRYWLILLKNWKTGAVGHGRPVGAGTGGGVVGAEVLSSPPRASAGGPAWRAS